MSTTSPESREKWQNLLILLAFGLFSQIFLLLNHGVFFDDWLPYTDVNSGNWTRLWQWNLDMGGYPFIYAVFRALALVSTSVLWFRILEVAALVIAAMAIYLILSREKITTPRESLVIAMLFLAYPGFEAVAAVVHVAYLAFYSAFFVGLLLYVKIDSAKPITAWIFRFVALVLLFFSFRLNSLLLFYYALLVALLIHRLSIQEKPLKVIAIFQSIFAKLDFWLIPLVYWVSAKIFFPTHGLYAQQNYNQIQLDPMQWITLGSTSLFNGVLTPLVKGFAMQDFPLGAYVLIAVVVGLALLPFIRGTMKSSEQQAFIPTFLGVLAGIILLIAAVFPYAMVGKAAAATGWDTRHALLLGLPLAVALFFLAKLLSSGLGKPGKIAMMTLLGILLTTFTSANMFNHLIWQERAIKDQAILWRLQQQPALQENTVFIIQDHYRVTTENYRFYEWSAMLHQIWPDQGRLGLDVSMYPPEFAFIGTQYHNERYFLADFEPRGCWALLNINKPSQEETTLENALRYWRAKLSGKAEFQSYLNRVIDMEVKPAHVNGIPSICARKEG